MKSKGSITLDFHSLAQTQKYFAWLARDSKEDKHALPSGEGGWAVMVHRSPHANLQPITHVCMIRIRKETVQGAVSS